MTQKESETLRGLLKLTEKMFGLLEQTAARGLTTLTPKDVKFGELTYVRQARALLGQPQDPRRRRTAPQNPAAESHGGE